MRGTVRLVLGMARKAVSFVRGHPDDDPGSAQVATRLVELVDRGEELATQQRTSLVTVAAATQEKAELRLSMEDDFGSLAGIAKSGAKVYPGLTVHRRLRRGVSEATFLTTVKVATAEARAAMDILAPFGLNEQLLASLDGGVAAYSAAMDRQAKALTAQVGAGAELEAVTGAIMDVIKNLDALYRRRFKNDAESLAAWKSARNVPWPGSPTARAADPTPAPEGGTGRAA